MPNTCTSNIAKSGIVVIWVGVSSPEKYQAKILLFGGLQYWLGIANAS